MTLSLVLHFDLGDVLVGELQGRRGEDRVHLAGPRWARLTSKLYY
jgi:hypothetical protein